MWRLRCHAVEPPRITLVVVGKRHHTRFFSIHRAKGGSPIEKVLSAQDKNLQAGLVIDHTVLFLPQFSFYLQSHDSPLGTAKSRHYVFIKYASEYTPTSFKE